MNLFSLWFGSTVATKSRWMRAGPFTEKFCFFRERTMPEDNPAACCPRPIHSLCPRWLCGKNPVNRVNRVKNVLRALRVLRGENSLAPLRIGVRNNLRIPWIYYGYFVAAWRLCARQFVLAFDRWASDLGFFAGLRQSVQYTDTACR